MEDAANGAQYFLPLVVAAQGVTIGGYKDLTVNFQQQVLAQPANTNAGFFIPAKAQGNKVPTEQWFEDHVIDEYKVADGSYILLDPSYGYRCSGAIAAAAELAWSTHAINQVHVQGDWVQQGGLIQTSNGPTYTGSVKDSDYFPMQTDNFVFPDQVIPVASY